MHPCAHYLLVSAAVTTNALCLGRRAAVGAITGTALLPVPSKAFEVKLPFDEDADTRRRRLNAELKAPPISDEVRACGSRLVGTYTDPKHPGCERRVAQIAGTRFASIRGVDEDGVPWVAGASIACADYNGVGKEQLIVGLRVEINLSSSRICGCSMAGADHWLISTQVDFTARGGGKDVVAVADYSATSATLTFPDGNAWTMVPCSNPNLKTAQQRAACASAK